MNKAELIEKIANKAGLTKKQTEDCLEAFEAVTIESLKKDEDVTLTGFGTFSAKHRHARMGVNPQKPTEKIQIPAVIIPKFKSGKALKDALKEVDASEPRAEIKEEETATPEPTTEPTNSEE